MRTVVLYRCRCCRNRVEVPTTEPNSAFDITAWIPHECPTKRDDGVKFHGIADIEGFKEIPDPETNEGE